MRSPAGVPLLACLLSGPLIAQQYDLRTFSLEQGLPSASVNALCEDLDGFLWIATDGGAARSEGLRFDTYGQAQGLTTDEVTALHAAPDGHVWMGCRDGAIACWLAGRFTVHPLDEAYPPTAVEAMVEDAQGDLWAAMPGLGILQWNETKTRLWTTTDGLPTLHVNALVLDPKGRLIAGTDSGLVIRQGERWTRVAADNSLPSLRVTAIYADSSGLLVGTNKGFTELGPDLAPLPLDERFLGIFPVALPDLRILDLIRARNGDLWLGTPTGLIHLDKHNGQPRVKLIAEANGLGHSLVRHVLQDLSGAVWAGTGFGGITKFTGDAFVHFTERDGLRSRIVSAIHRTPDGLLWLATASGGVACWKPSGLKNYGPAEGLIDPYVLGLSEDRSGRLLAGTAAHGLFRLKDERFHHVALGGSEVERVNAIALDESGRSWVATDAGLYREDNTGTYTFVEGPRISISDLEVAGDTLWATTVKGLYRTMKVGEQVQLLPVPFLQGRILTTLERDGQGNLWIGSKEHGLFRLNGNSLDSLTTHSGLSSNAIEQVLLDAYENVWVGSRRGIDLLELDVLQEHVLSVKHYGTDEGFIGLETFRNASMLDTDSTLWFGTLRGATRYDAREVLRDPREPNIHFTDLRLFYEKPDWAPWCDSLGRSGLPVHLQLPHDKNHLTFSFTGISLAYPERVRYRYTLEGYDPDWSPITSTDRVVYSNIPPGDYTFRVLARNASGVWTEHPESFAFSIAAPFWATTWFRISGGTALLLGFFGFVRLRTRNLRKDRERLEGMVEVRTRELATEKERSDALLRNILPASTAEELKQHGAAEARRYDACTVLFSDFKDFTNFSSAMDSDTLVSELDHYFRLFDQLTDTFGLEKIKTIGDAYMCASGIPEPTPTHALNALLMGLGMLKDVERSNAERAAKGRIEWPIRIGIHTGPVVTGVVGEKKFAYDIWGDTVNLASRMESHGEAGKLNISGVTYAQVMDYVEVIPRGPIKVKGKGELHMYFVARLKPAYSADAAGTIPNEALLAVAGRVAQ
jgi:ligand-binding sensor domain-containing protein/class 3 adenylate cyclase